MYKQFKLKLKLITVYISNRKDRISKKNNKQTRNNKAFQQFLQFVNRTRNNSAVLTMLIVGHPSLQDIIKK